MTIEEFEARQTEIRARLQEIDSEYVGQTFPDEIREEWNTLNEEHDRNVVQLHELRARRDRVAALAASDDNRESGAPFQVPTPNRTTGEDIYDLSTIRASVASPQEANRELRDRALRAIEGTRFPHENADEGRCQSHIERLLETVGTKHGDMARHILATGSPVYQRAFAKHLSGQGLSTDESRALSVGVGKDGGFALPFALDPTVVPTSNHSVNPYRAIARVENTTTNTWKGVTSAGVSVGYSTEGSQVAETVLELEQPEVDAERATAFVPFSIEVGQDWGGIQTELARVVQDAKDDLEAEKFTAGSGNDEPEGVLTGILDTGSGSGALVTEVLTGDGESFGVGDVYKVEEELGARFRQRAQWIGNRSIYNKVRQFDTAGGASLWKRLPEGLANQVPTPGNTGAELIGYPANEASAMDGKVETGKYILILGDFRYYLIADRIGMSVEIVQHLMGAQGRPTGQRGFFAIWRNGATVISPNAFRVLEVDVASGSGG